MIRRKSIYRQKGLFLKCSAIPQGFSWGIAFFGTIFDKGKKCFENLKDLSIEQ
jgi:hypothetical protein